MGKYVVAAVLCAAFAGMTPAFSAEDSGAEPSLESRVDILEKGLQHQYELSDRQQRQIDAVRAGKAGASAVDELRAEDADGAGGEPVELPSWLTGFTFSGDLRLRYEGLFYDDDTRDRNRGRFRLRIGVRKAITDELVAGFRLASGSSSDPTSTNQTLTDEFSDKDVWIDLAYLIYKPAWWKGTTIGAGKFKNPFVKTNMVWDSDVNPEGVYETVKFDTEVPVDPFVTVAWLLVEDQSSATDANAGVFQGGFDWAMDGVTWSSAAAYYDFFNIEEPGNFRSANGNTTAGGKLTAGDFDVLNLTNSVKFKVQEVPVKVWADFAKNLTEDAPAPMDGLDTAYALGFDVGENKDKGDWSFGYKYANIEANSVWGAISDSDFGFANRKGHVVGVAYNLHKKVTAGLTLLQTEPEKGSGPDRTTVQGDIVIKF